MNRPLKPVIGRSSKATPHKGKGAQKKTELNINFVRRTPEDLMRSRCQKYEYLVP